MVKFKRYIANKLVALARKIDPPNEAALNFFNDRLIETVILGKSAVKITALSQEEIVKMENKW